MEDYEKGQHAHWVYIVGIVLFGLSYEFIKQTLANDILFVGSAILYLFFLSVLAKRIEQKLEKKN